jgi:hypothetical protein
MPNPASGGLPHPASYTSMSGYVIDNVTGLWWQHPIDVLNDQGKSCAAGCTQTDALAYCAHLTLGGHCDWRLPTRVELVSIVDFAVSNPAIDTLAFPSTPVAQFWTSSPYAGDTSRAWYVYFGGGYTAYDVTASASYRVRCVR